MPSMYPEGYGLQPWAKPASRPGPGERRKAKFTACLFLSHPLGCLMQTMCRAYDFEGSLNSALEQPSYSYAGGEDAFHFGV